MDTYSPSYSINKNHIYHVSKCSSPHYGSFIDRGDNGGLAGSDVTILEWTGRTVSVTGIGNHELPGLDIVTCAALLNTNHSKVILIMHEYAFYGRGNTIHSPGQIEWFQNTCDDKSFHVGGKQVITFLDGYATPLQCRTGLMYMNLLCQPIDADLNTFPHVVLTGPHEWDPSVLDYTHTTTSGDPIWAPDPSQHGTHDPRIDEFDNFKGRVHHTLTHSPGISTIAQHKHAIKTPPIDFEKLRTYFCWVNKHTTEKSFQKPLNGLLLPLGTLCGSISNPDSQLSTSLGDLKRLLLIPSSLIHLPLTLVLPWPKSVLVKELESLMSTPSNPNTNLSTH